MGDVSTNITTTHHASILSNTVIMQDPTPPLPAPHAVLPGTSTNIQPSVSIEESLSAEDKMILYAVLQDIANELRRIHREHKKYQAQREH